MNLSTLVTEVSRRHGLTQKLAREALETAFQLIANAAASGERVAIPHFGVFARSSRKARWVVIPGSSRLTYLPATAEFRFRASKGWRHVIAEASQQPEQQP